MEVVFTIARNTSLAVAGGAWIASLLWVAADARARFSQPRPVYAAVALAGILPIAGCAVWLVLRPAETLRDRVERRLRRGVLEREVDGGDRCLLCRTELRQDFLCCPGCGLELRRPCRVCEQPIDLAWRACPYCAASAEEDETVPVLRPAAR